jgi:hypothetical protein
MGNEAGEGGVWDVIFADPQLSKADGTDPKDTESEGRICADTFEAGADCVLEALSIVVGAGILTSGGSSVLWLPSVSGAVEEAEWLPSGGSLLGSLTDLGIPEACLRVVRAAAAADRAISVVLESTTAELLDPVVSLYFASWLADSASVEGFVSAGVSDIFLNGSCFGNIHYRNPRFCAYV